MTEYEAASLFWTKWSAIGTLSAVVIALAATIGPAWKARSRQRKSQADAARLVAYEVQALLQAYTKLTEGGVLNGLGHELADLGTPMLSAMGDLSLLGHAAPLLSAAMVIHSSLREKAARRLGSPFTEIAYEDAQQAQIALQGAVWELNQLLGRKAK